MSKRIKIKTKTSGGVIEHAGTFLTSSNKLKYESAPGVFSTISKQAQNIIKLDNTGNAPGEKRFLSIQNNTNKDITYVTAGGIRAVIGSEGGVGAAKWPIHDPLHTIANFKVGGTTALSTYITANYAAKNENNKITWAQIPEGLKKQMRIAGFLATDVTHYTDTIFDLDNVSAAYGDETTLQALEQEQGKFYMASGTCTLVKRGDKYNIIASPDTLNNMGNHNLRGGDWVIFSDLVVDGGGTVTDYNIVVVSNTYRNAHYGVKGVVKLSNTAVITKRSDLEDTTVARHEKIVTEGTLKKVIKDHHYLPVSTHMVNLPGVTRTMYEGAKLQTDGSGSLNVADFNPPLSVGERVFNFAGYRIHQVTTVVAGVANMSYASQGYTTVVGFTAGVYYRNTANGSWIYRSNISGDSNTASRILDYGLSKVVEGDMIFETVV